MLSNEIAVDYLSTMAGKIPIVTSKLTYRDFLGGLKVRIDMGRMNYSVAPGLYAIGHPNENSPVFVTANYKLSFDSLRKELSDINGWILVLDTKGINVWCAAGKGTFGTKELINRLQLVNLDKIVTHRQLLVPQLGAVGVSAHKVKELTGFKVIYGPIRAKDIPAFLKAGNKATDSMRQVKFKFLDRLLLAPLEVVQGFKYFIIAAIIIFLLSGLAKSGFSINQALATSPMEILYLTFAYLAGTFLTPLFLPVLPGRPFSLKGFFMAVLVYAGLMFFSTPFTNLGQIEKIAWFLMMTTISSFFAMNFTGASTYTSLSGVKKEMRFAVPLQIGGFAIGFILWLVARFI
jgi:hypothetical protein